MITPSEFCHEITEEASYYLYLYIYLCILKEHNEKDLKKY